MIKAIDLQELFETTIRSKDKVSGKIYQTSDMEEFLNEAQTGWLRANIINFDSSERSKKALAPVTSNYEMGGIVSVPTDGLFWSVYGLPEDTYSVVMESITVNDKTVKVKPITYDEYLINIDNKYRRPYSKLAWRLNTDNGNAIISIYPTISNYKISYVKEPAKISISDNTDFIFDNEAKIDIVNAAVALAIKSVEIEQSTTKELHSENV